MADSNLVSLVTHRPPMLLLDSLLHVDEAGSSCQVTIVEKMPFVTGTDGLPAWVGLELMAQTIAAWGGWQASKEGRSVHMGLLLGCRKYESELALFPLGSCLKVTAQKVVRDGNMGVFQCTIHLGERVVAKAQVNTYLPDGKELEAVLAR